MFSGQLGRWLIILLLLWMTHGAKGISYAPPDTRSWEEITKHFAAGGGDGKGPDDGYRLLEIDRERATQFLLPFLTKQNPEALRIKAIEALAWPQFAQVTPTLAALARDTAEEEPVRVAAIDPGLSYTRHPDALRAATALVEDASPAVRMAAYRALANQGGKEAQAVLEKRLRVKDPATASVLIHVFSKSEHPAAAKVIFESCTPEDLPARARDAYASAMLINLYAPAQDAMFKLLEAAERPSQMGILQYFAAYPREEVVPYLTRFIESDRNGCDYSQFDTVSAFLASSKIAAASKEKLQALVTTRKVEKRR